MSRLGPNMLLTFSGKRPGTLLNILQYTGHPHKTKNYLVQDTNSAEVEKPDIDYDADLLSAYHEVLAVIVLDLSFSAKE